MTTTTTFQGMEPGAKSSSRVLRPPGGGSNISFGEDGEKPPVRKNKMASSVFAEPEDPYANRRNNPPVGQALILDQTVSLPPHTIKNRGKPTGVLCGEPSAPLRRGGNHNASHSADAPAMDGEISVRDNDTSAAETDAAPEEAPAAEEPAGGLPPGRRNPPGGKSSLILG